MFAIAGALAQPQNSGPDPYPAAMSMNYNPLLWQGEDAQFARDMLHASYCTAQVSKTVAARTQDSAIETVAATIAREQHKLYRQLHNLARTFNFRLPSKSELQDCPSASRIAELSGRQMDSDYMALLLKSTAANVSRFEAEVAMPRMPGNWTLWNLAKKDLPAMRSEEAAVKSVQQTVAKKKVDHGQAHFPAKRPHLPELF